MEKGIIYVATSEIEGLVKIGRTQNFEKRKKELETQGYYRQRCEMIFAIKVDQYEFKENLLHKIFGKSRAGKTEFFAEDVKLVIQTMSAFEGTQIYPTNESKEQIFNDVSEQILVEDGVIPKGEYTLKIKIKATNSYCSGILLINDEGKMILKKGAILGPLSPKKQMTWYDLGEEIRKNGFILDRDVPCKSISMAAALVRGQNTNGWEKWKNSKGEKIDIYRNKEL